MDLNELFARHQLALGRAGQAGDSRSRQVYYDCARYYAGRIRTARSEMSAPGQRGI